MKINIEKLVSDENVRNILYMLEEIEEGADKSEVLSRIRLMMQNSVDEDQSHMYELLCMHLGDYESGIIDLQHVKEDIFMTLEECKQIHRTV